MNVGIDLRPLVAGESGGLVQLVEGLAPALFAAGRHQWRVFHTNRYRFPLPLPANASQEEIAPTPAAIDAALAQANIDVLLRVFPTDEPLAFPAAREVTLIPDLLHVDHPEFLDPVVCERRSVAFARAIEEGGAVVVPSRYTQSRIRAAYPNATEPIVVRPAPPRLFKLLCEPLSPAEAEKIPSGPFFLYPARGWAHKNHAVLLRAWQKFRRDHPAHTLVLTGTSGCVPELLASYGDRSVRDLGYVSDRLLATLFRCATAMVFPSCYEGFGLPLLEAFAFGLPVIASNAASLPEVGGDAVTLVDPSDPDALADAMERIVDDFALRVELTARGLARLGEYNATASAQTLLGALEAAASRPIPMHQVMAGQRVLQTRIAECEGHLAERLALIVRQHDEGREQQELLREQHNAALVREELIQNQRAELERLTVYERLLADAPPGPLISVIVAMGDTRGDTARCVRAWTREQTFPRERIEVIVAFDGKNPRELECVRHELGPMDRVVRLATDSDTALWDEGARHARGRWFYFAEAHSYGEPDCLEEMLRYLLTEGVSAASSQSRGGGTTLTALLEECEFEKVSAQRLTPGHWNKLFFRGCAVERTAYLRAGGLRGEYGLFGEPLFAAELDRLRIRVGFSRRSVIRHFNAASFRDLEGHIRDYTLHECKFRLTHPGQKWHAYFGCSPEWDNGGRMDATLARIEARLLLKSLRRGEGALRRLAKLLPACVLGSRLWRGRVAAKMAKLERHIAHATDRDARIAAFAEWWSTVAVRARIDFVTRLDEHTQLLTFAEPTAIDEFPAPLLVGFHPLERFAGLPFRWSEPLAHIKLAIPPGEQMVELVVGELRPPLLLEAFVNGHVAPVEDLAAEEGVIRVTVREAHRRVGLQYLTLKCAPWSAPGDSRKLGVPLFGIRRIAEQRSRLAA